MVVKITQQAILLRLSAAGLAKSRSHSLKSGPSRQIPYQMLSEGHHTHRFSVQIKVPLSVSQYGPRFFMKGQLKRLTVFQFFFYFFK